MTGFFEMIWQEVGGQFELLLRIVIAGFLGMAIGFERKNRNKEAGIRTHAIVAFGAALIMVVSKYGFSDIGTHDASRIASQIVSGVGFLGAGIIFVRDNSSVSGLTTAAGIWATAGVGMSVGAGQYFIGICAGVMLVLLQELLHRVHFLSRDIYHTPVKLTLERGFNLHELEEFIASHQIGIEAMKINWSNQVDTTVEMDLIFSAGQDKTELLNNLTTYPGVISVRG